MISISRSTSAVVCFFIALWLGLLTAIVSAEKPTESQAEPEPNPTALENKDTNTEIEDSAKAEKKQFTPIADSAPHATEEYASLYTAHEYREPDGSDGNSGYTCNYRLYEPDDLNADEMAPLFIWLHGLGEAGEENVLHLRWLENSMGFDAKGLARRKMFVLAMQCPSETSWGGKNLAALKSIVDQVLETRPIDQERVYLSGVSAGGGACWKFGILHPELFAAILPLSCGGGDLSRIHRLKDVPVWAFHKSFDTIEPVRQTIETLNKAGGNAHLTEQRQMGHVVVLNKYKGLLDWWMFSQRCGQPASFRPPGYLPEVELDEPDERVKEKTWTIYQLGLQIGLPLIIFIACIREINRRKMAKEAPRDVTEQ